METEDRIAKIIKDAYDSTSFEDEGRATEAAHDIMAIYLPYKIDELQAKLAVALEEVEYYKEKYYYAHTDCARRGAEITRLQNLLNERLKYSD